MDAVTLQYYLSRPMVWNVPGLFLTAVGVILLYRYGMAFRVPATVRRYSSTNLEPEKKIDSAISS
jgi:hypothetical protein